MRSRHTTVSHNMQQESLIAILRSFVIQYSNRSIQFQ